MYAARIIWSLLRGRQEWRIMKRRLDTQIGTMEPYMESFPSLVVFCTIYLTEVFMKKNLQFEHADGPYGRGSVPNIMFFIGMVSSLFLSIFSLVKFFKNCPTHLLPSWGPAAGFASLKDWLTFFSVLFTNSTKVLILMGLIKGRVAEKLLFSLNTVGPGHHQQLTLCTTLYNFHEYLFNQTDSINDTIVFYSSTGHPFQ